MTEICKAAAVKAIGRAEADDLALINQLARRELTADEEIGRASCRERV